MVEVKLLGTDCARCKQLQAVLDDIVGELGSDAVRVEKISDIATIASYGVLAVPALVVDGEVKSVGVVPSKKEILGWIEVAREGGE